MEIRRERDIYRERERRGRLTVKKEENKCDEKQRKRERYIERKRDIRVRTVREREKTR